MDLTAITTAELAAFRTALSRLEPASGDAERIDRISALEALKAAAAAAQAREASAFTASRRAAAASEGIPPERRDRGITAQLALALHCSPWAAGRWARTADVLVHDMPQTMAALTHGRTTERRAWSVTRETIFLSREDRRSADIALSRTLTGLGDRAAEAEARRIAYRLDPAGYTDRARGEHHDRRVTLRPAPITMCRLSALLPLPAGISTHLTLTRDADTLRAAGDPRTRSQLMADLLVERVTGTSTASRPPVEIELLITDAALFGAPSMPATPDSPGTPGTPGRDEPGEIIGYGPLPAPLARALALGDPDPDGAPPENAGGQGRLGGAGADDSRHDRTAVGTAAGAEDDDAVDTPRWIRRVYTDPRTGTLADVDTRRRLFTSAQRRHVRLRDRTCRTPWCDAQIRHTDHVTPHARGGPTSLDNAQGLCAACNHARQATGWTGTSDGDTITITTPTGHTYTSPAPELPGLQTVPATQTLPAVTNVDSRVNPPTPADAVSARGAASPVNSSKPGSAVTPGSPPHFETPAHSEGPPSAEGVTRPRAPGRTTTRRPVSEPERPSRRRRREWHARIGAA